MLYSTIEKHTERWRFLTLTYDPKIKSISDQYKDISKMWDRFRRRLYRTDDLKNMKWIRSVEKQSSGNLHIHAIVNKFLKKDEIIKHWSELGGGGIDITLNPKCTEHKRKCCTQCYPAQWLHLEECTDHKKKFCKVCFKYLAKCEIHSIESCGVCYPSNIFDYNKFAADYLTVELIKSKNHQDVYRTGFDWWKARRRSLGMSRNIKLKKVSNEIQYRYESKVGNLCDVQKAIEFYQNDNSKMVETFENMIVISDII